jgi:hypothetical protein
MAAAPITITDFVTDPRLLGDFYAGPSWAAAKVILRAMHGLPLRGAEAFLFHELAGGRDAPQRPAKQVVIKAGRRFGKDSIAAGDMTFSAAITDHRPFLRPGERAVCLCVSVDKASATRFLRYVKGYFSACPLLKSLVSGETREGLILESRAVEIVVTSSAYQTARGLTAAHICLNEAAFMPKEHSAAPDIELYRSLLPALATLPTSRLMVVSSPYTRDGLLYDLVSKHYAKNHDILVFSGTSRQGNPTLDPAMIEQAVADDPVGAPAEWLAAWRDGVASFIPKEVIDALIDRDIVARAPTGGVVYFGFVDAAGGVVGGDSFTCAIAHAEDDAVVLDCIFERPGPFNPGVVVAEICALLRSYGITSVTGDRYSAAWVRSAFTDNGCGYHQSQRDRSAIHSDFLPLATSGRARLLESAKMVSQFTSLQRISGAGKDRVDHPRGGADDISNSVAGALTLAAAKPIGSEGIICTPIICDEPIYDRWSARWWGEGAVPMPMQGDFVSANDERYTIGGHEDTRRRILARTQG